MHAKFLLCICYGWFLCAIWLNRIGATAERDGDIHRIFQEEHTSSRQFYRYLDIAYMNPDKVNEILSGKSHISVNDLFQIARENAL